VSFAVERVEVSDVVMTRERYLDPPCVARLRRDELLIVEVVPDDD